MRRTRAYLLRGSALLLLAAVVAVALVSRARAHELVTNPYATRKMPDKTPADFGMPYQEVTVKTTDGFTLVGWQVPSVNGATLILVHGYKDSRAIMLRVAELFHRHGYGLLILSVRAHDRSDGELITFGHYEMQDLNAWYDFEEQQPGINLSEVGLFGVSMGGSLGLQYAAQNPRIASVVTDSAFSSLEDTISTSVKFFTGLPPFPFAPMIQFWTEREAGFDISEINARRWIGQIAPRPVFILQGDADVVVSPQSGERLYEAAGSPKEFWHEADTGHAQFLDKHPVEFEQRVVGFFDRTLLHGQ